MKYTKTMIAIIMVSSAQYLWADTWATGKPHKIESFAEKVYVRWDGPNTEECRDRDVSFTVETMGNEGAFDRAYAMALTGYAAGKFIRFHLDGCNAQGLQQGDIIQICDTVTCDS